MFGLCCDKTHYDFKNNFDELIPPVENNELRLVYQSESHFIF